MTRRLIFVFGSNLAGRHGAGAAKHARLYYGAEYGVGKGLQGNAYALPTKDEKLASLSLERIAGYAREFIEFARQHPELDFKLTRVGCGLAGYTDDQIGPMFQGVPENVQVPEEWRHLV